jgi:ankyrin repeat protein
VLSVKLTDADDSTPLHVSAAFGLLETTKIMVEEGAAINKTNKYFFLQLSWVFLTAYYKTFVTSNK